MMSLRCNLETLRNVDRFQNDLVAEDVCQEVLDNRSRPHHFRWSTMAVGYLLVNREVHNSLVFVQFVALHDPIFGSNFATFFVLFASIPEFAF